MSEFGEKRRTVIVPKVPETFEKSYERIAGKEKYRKFLVSQQGLKDPFATAGTPNPDTTFSNKLIGPPSPDRQLEILHRKYRTALKDYGHKAQPMSDKIDFRGQEIDVGHKLHLNVPVSEVLRVSEYLKLGDFYHKFLHGGDPRKGKIFTLYVGSHEVAYRLAQRISGDIGSALARPMASEEIEYAPNVIGRFAVRNEKYTQYGEGLRGVPCLEDLYEQADYQPLPKSSLPAAFERTYEALSGDFGAYFHG